MLEGSSFKPEILEHLFYKSIILGPFVLFKIELSISV